MRNWIDKHILRRTAAQLPRIVLIEGDFAGVGSSYRLVDGYPELGPQVRIPILKHRHQRIDGYPATVFSWERRSGGSVRRGTILLVSVRDQSVFYEISGQTGAQNPDRSDQINREIEAIIASFHVEKVTSGKR